MIKYMTLFVMIQTLFSVIVLAKNTEGAKHISTRPSKDNAILLSLPQEMRSLIKKGDKFLREVNGNDTCASDSVVSFVYNAYHCAISGWAVFKGSGGEGWCAEICGVDKKDDVITIVHENSIERGCSNKIQKKMTLRQDKEKKYIYHLDGIAWIDASKLSKVETVVSERPCDGP